MLLCSAHQKIRTKREATRGQTVKKRTSIEKRRTALGLAQFGHDPNLSLSVRACPGRRDVRGVHHSHRRSSHHPPFSPTPTAGPSASPSGTDAPPTDQPSGSPTETPGSSETPDRVTRWPERSAGLDRPSAGRRDRRGHRAGAAHPPARGARGGALRVHLARAVPAGPDGDGRGGGAGRGARSRGADAQAARPAARRRRVSTSCWRSCTAGRWPPTTCPRKAASTSSNATSRSGRSTRSSSRTSTPTPCRTSTSISRATESRT